MRFYLLFHLKEIELVHKAIKILLGLMLVTSFMTHTIDIDSPNFIIARMTFSDIFGLLAIFLTVILFLKKQLVISDIPINYWLAGVLIGTFLLGVFTSLAPYKTVSEILILGYLILLSGAIYFAFKNDIQHLFYLIMFSTAILSAIGLYDLFAINNGFVTIFKSAKKNYGVSGFRYFGQAANYTFTMLTILIPLKYSDLGINYSKWYRVLLNISIILGSLFLIVTGRISIIISFIIGLLLFIGFTRNKKINIHFLYLFLVFLIFGVVIYTSAPDLVDTIVYRFQSRVTHRDMSTPEASFIVQNIYDTIKSFNDNIWFGSGLGGFLDNYSEFEIHGTYFKILGETGLLGTLGYGIFIVYLIDIVLKNRKSINSNFFKYFVPFFSASLVAWSYNYHLRKKEFWILFALIMILNFKVRKPTDE